MRSRGTSPLLILLVLLPIGAIILPTAVLMAAGMVPTIVAFMVDRDTEKSAGISVGAMNFCGVMPFAIDLWQRGHVLDVTIGLLLRPETWLFMYGAAAAGWLIYYGVPPLVAGAAVFRDSRKIKDLEDGRAELIQEWGIEVTGRDENGQPTQAPAAEGGEPQAQQPAMTPIQAKLAAANAAIED